MFYDKKITLTLTKKGKVNDMGIYEPSESSVYKTIHCDVQPYSKDRLYRDYGFDEEVKYRVFSDPYPDDIKNGVTVKYNNKDYKIVRVIEWDDYFDWMIDDV